MYRNTQSKLTDYEGKNTVTGQNFNTVFISMDRPLRHKSTRKQWL